MKQWSAIKMSKEVSACRKKLNVENGKYYTTDMQEREKKMKLIFGQWYPTHSERME